MISDVVFDVDGTLLDTMPDLTRLATDVISTFFDVDPMDAMNEYLLTIGQPFPDQLALLYPGRGDHAAAVEVYDQERRRSVYPNANPTRYAQTVVHALHELGITVWANSSTEQTMLAKRMFNLFHLDFCWAMNGETKADRLRCVRDRAEGNVLFVGDAPYDGDVAEMAYVPFMAVKGVVSPQTWVKRGYVGLPLLPNLLGVLAEVRREQ